MKPEQVTLLHHLQQLVKRPSITPDDANCQQYIQHILEPLGFRCQFFPKNKVNNLYAEIGSEGHRLVFAGHTDVVEPGPIENWKYPPFQLTIENNVLYGRGVADMKGAIAAMLMIAEDYKCLPSQGILGFMITSAEEGDDYLDGTPYIMQKLYEQGINIDYCIVGEPSATLHSGDTIKNGRRGSMNGQIIIKGKQGHVAYPHLADNALHKALPFLTALSQKVWDKGHVNFPATSLQITNIVLSTSAKNVVPGTVTIEFNIRFNTHHTSSELQQAIMLLAQQHDLQIDVTWQVSGEPFLTQFGRLIEVSQQAIETCCHQLAELSTSGGTSDARFIAPYQIEVIEIGVPNHTIHQPNECIHMQDLEKIVAIYSEICRRIF
jgi:succinyl-diaminopimelate desuccinylase